MKNFIIGFIWELVLKISSSVMIFKVPVFHKLFTGKQIRDMMQRGGLLSFWIILFNLFEVFSRNNLEKL